MEVSLESSFQPTIQLYLLFPNLIQQIEGDKFVFQVNTIFITSIFISQNILFVNILVTHHILLHITC